MSQMTCVVCGFADDKTDNMAWSGQLKGWACEKCAEADSAAPGKYTGRGQPMKRPLHCLSDDELSDLLSLTLAEAWRSGAGYDSRGCWHGPALPRRIFAVIDEYKARVLQRGWITPAR